MAKKVEAYIKLQVAAGKANPSPPVGPALGQHGLNIMEFCKAFNAQTQSLEAGAPIPVVISVYSDRSFTFELKTPPASFLLKKDEYRDAINGFNLDQSIAIRIGHIIDDNTLTEYAYNKYPQYLVGPWNLGQRFLMHGLFTEHLYAKLEALRHSTISIVEDD